MDQQTRAPLRTANPDVPSPRQTGARHSKGISLGLTIVSSLSLILTLLGYGVCLAVEATFGLPHQTVYASVLDLIGLSVYALLALLIGLSENTWQPLWEHAWGPGLGAATGMFCLVCCLVFMQRRRSRSRAGTNRFGRFFRLPTAQDSTGQLIGKGAIGSGLFGGVVVAAPFVIAIALLASVCLMSFLPMFGMELGRYYLRKYVVAPTACEPVESRAVRVRRVAAPRQKNTPTVAVANCVSLLKDETPVVSGRVVVSTPTAIVLFEPISGAVRRVPIDDLTVLPVAMLHPTSQR